MMLAFSLPRERSFSGHALRDVAAARTVQPGCQSGLGRVRFIDPLSAQEQAIWRAKDTAYPAIKVATMSVIGTAQGRSREEAMCAPR
jgi:hypothetical protein